MARTHRTEQVSVPREVLDSATCNSCGKVFYPQPNKSVKVHDFTANFGWLSNHDGQEWKFDLCEDCLIKIIKGFRVVPEGFMLPKSTHPVPHAPHQILFEHWKKTKVWDPNILNE